jgi:hypothetical protein
MQPRILPGYLLVNLVKGGLQMLPRHWRSCSRIAPSSAIGTCPFLVVRANPPCHQSPATVNPSTTPLPRLQQSDAHPIIS